MSLATVHARAAVGIAAPTVAVEVHVAGGLPGLTIVGLPTTAVREARDRVRAALQNSGFSLPPRRVTVNLAPADLPKDGGRFDLAIAIGILAASDQLRAEIDGLELLGELSLSGELRPVERVLPSVIQSRQDQTRLLIPGASAREARIAAHPRLYQADHLLEVCAALQGQQPWQRIPVQAPPPAARPVHRDLSEVFGQAQAKRALEITAAGNHNLLMLGPPGSGKSLLAQCLPGLCPQLDTEQALEVASLQSASHAGFQPASWRQAPFRCPHHSASAAAVAGGGSLPQPGEISLAHQGVLFLDELPEFRREVLEVLREPLETGCVRISRVREQVEFPARFMLVAAMNPCPCGYLGDRNALCHCSPDQIQKYRRRISGPLLDRIDLQLHVPRLPAGELLRPRPADTESSASVRVRVAAARARQLQRSGCLNTQLPPEELQRVCALDPAALTLLQQAGEHLRLSGRALHRVMKVARSIADLAGQDRVLAEHLAEALQLRQGLAA